MKIFKKFLFISLIIVNIYNIQSLFSQNKGFDIQSLLNLNINEKNDKNLTEQIDDMLKEQFPKCHIPSLAVVVSDKDKTLYKTALGQEKNVDKPYVIGSMSKSFTALSIMILYNRRAFFLEDTLDNITNSKGENLKEYFKNEEDLAKITIYQLLTHTSGLEREVDKGKGKINKNLQGKYSYSNYGYGILGRIIEIKSCLSYEDFLRLNIFFQLKMNKTTSVYEKGVKNGLVKGYQNIFGFYYSSDVVKNGYTENEGVMIPAGYISTTLDDMANYLRFWMREDDFLIPYELKKMMLNNTVDAGQGYFYGFGWMYAEVSQGEGKKNAICHLHDGTTYTFNSIMYFFPEKNIAVAGFINAYDSFSLDKQATIKGGSIIALIMGRKYADLGNGYIGIHIFMDIIYLVLLLVLIKPLVELIKLIRKKQQIHYFICDSKGIAAMVYDGSVLILLPILFYILPIFVLGSWKRTLQLLPEFAVYLFFAIFGTILLAVRIGYYIFRIKHPPPPVDESLIKPEEENEGNTSKGINDAESGGVLA